MKQYLMVTISVSDQMIIDNAPTRLFHDGWEEKVEL